MSIPVCRHCGGLIRANVPYEDQFCSEECYAVHEDEIEEDTKMNGIEVLSNPWAWSR